MWIEELPNGKYKFTERYKVNGKYKRVSVTYAKNTSVTRKQAQKDLEEKINHFMEQSDISTVTFGEVAKGWLSLYKKTVKHTSYAIHSSQVDVLNKTFKNTNIATITHSEINHYFLNRMIKEGTKRSSMSKYLFVFRQVLKHASEYFGIDTESIIQKITLPNINQSDSTELKYLEKDEVKIVLSFLETKTNPTLSNITKVMLGIGARYGEVVSLRESDIDFDTMSITINRTWNPNYQIYDLPKNGKVREVFFPPELKNVLKSQIQYAREYTLKNGFEKNGLLFRGRKGTPYTINLMNRYLSSIKLKSNKKITSHIFRHTFITRLVESGVPAKLIAEQVGHKDTKMIEQVYTHFSEKMKQQQKELLLNINHF